MGGGNYTKHKRKVVAKQQGKNSLVSGGKGTRGRKRDREKNTPLLIPCQNKGGNRR